MSSCSYCERPVAHAVLVRVGELPSPYADPTTTRDASRLVVVRLCGVEHKRPGDA